MSKVLILQIFFVTVSPQSRSQSFLKNNIQTHMYFLTDDKLEGRRTGTPGEQKACDYICKQFKKNKLGKPNGWDSYVQSFEVNEGKKLSDKNELSSKTWKAVCNKDFVPIEYSAQRNLIISSADKVSFYNLMHLRTTAFELTPSYC